MQKLYGVLGWPVAHSASPAMMNAAFAASGVDGVYLAFAVPKTHLQSALDGLWALGAGGVNITIPHKLGAYQWAAEHTDEAKLAGAVNTLRFPAEVPDSSEAMAAAGTIGHNTDVSGWWTSLQAALRKPPRRVVILGAGGAARAALAGLALYAKTAEVLVAARDERKAAATVESFQEYISVKPIAWAKREDAIAEADVIVNATPIGMWPNDEASPIDDEGCLQRGQVVQDMVYRPLATRLLQQAARRQAVRVDGLEMLVHQGAAAFEFWTGKTAPVSVMRSAAREFLGL
ncbi:shikimate dehydrogenase [Alicyclobacillus herbarius]|uniref:shikimate dehydrogenase n=1 Tax=Alicyclobacillus herbarius TaxID=122960 RepID=UPI000414223D|nr:shikimate dehydrogenase [Alicyclobacillus herbarius]